MVRIKYYYIKKNYFCEFFFDYTSTKITFVFQILYHSNKIIMYLLPYSNSTAANIKTRIASPFYKIVD